MSKTRNTARLSPQRVSKLHFIRLVNRRANIVVPGSGCMAALEAEKWLAEQDVVEDGPEADTGAKSQSGEIA